MARLCDMRTIIVLIIVFLLMVGCVLPPLTKTSHRIYNEHGKYKGRIDIQGRTFNEHGRYNGRIDSSGRIYDEHGRYKGIAK